MTTKKLLCLLLLSVMGFSFGYGQAIPTPKDHFGFSIGDNYQLSNYSQAESYFQKLAAISDRVLLKENGMTEEGRAMYVMVISSPENLENIEHYRQISQQMARAEDLTDEQAKVLAREGKPVVWIDGGLHSTEMVGSHQLIELYYRLLSQDDPETMRILDDVIILLAQVNPDGQELVADWYMQESDPDKRNMSIPRLYQKYVGHDNNRDFYMMNMKETTNIARAQYIDWMPQIIYNHHQSAPAGAVVAGPPYRDPFNFVFDPLLITGIDAVGSAMINRLNIEDKPGYTRLDGSVYSTWWNGGLRTTPYFHNMIGILTEMAGSPSPDEIPFIPERLIPDNATPFPVRPQEWSFRRSIEYSVSLNYGVLDYASKHGAELLYGIYTMGKNNIRKGSEDYWSLQPKNIGDIRQKYEADLKAGLVEKQENVGRRSNAIPIEYYDAVFKNPELRDAKGYILSADQEDFPTAVKFTNTLIKSGVSVEKAQSQFTVDGKNYPAGSYIVRTSQAFRPHVMDMFEPQDHPNDFLYPGGPPVRPYDAAGWTLAFQMGVDFDRIVNSFDGPFEKMEYGELQEAPEKQVASSNNGYYLSPKTNDSFIAVNDLLKAGVPVHRLTEAAQGFSEGAFYIPSSGYETLKDAGTELGVQAIAATSKPTNTVEVAPGRIALFDQYGGSMTSGWTRWLLEQFHFPFEVIYPSDIDKGSLNSKYDMILFMGRAIPAPGDSISTRRMPDAKDVPRKYRSWLGVITPETSIPNLVEFMEKGGSVVTVGESSNLALHLGLPVESALSQVQEGEKKELSSLDYYVPGSILNAKLDTHEPTNWGMNDSVDVVFNRSPVFRLGPNASNKGLTPLAWFDQDKILRSGWAWGEAYLHNAIAAFKAPVGDGEILVVGPEIIFRGQAHGTFKMLFNNLYRYSKN